ncbi:MAG: hypothetical protein KC502_07450 [Myxococcales bacterium]|nr:hypothetical protein [Myxococcales bacterium]
MKQLSSPSRFGGHSQVSLWLMSLLSVAALAGCGVTNNAACTEIGCANQVLLRPVAPSGALQTAVSGSITLQEGTFAFNCSAKAPTFIVSCTADGLVVMTDQAEFTIDLVTDVGGTTGHVVKPVYVTSRPNGPNCEPICKQGTVDVPLSTGSADAGSADATGTDAATQDSGATDTGATDTGATDTGATDTGAATDIASSDTAGSDASADAGPFKPGCCTKAGSCGSTGVCATDICKDTASLKTGECWTAGECASGQSCAGAVVCACGQSCFVPDSPGACKGATKCHQLDPTGYGACDMVLGVGWNGTKCVHISGCSCGTDCDKIFKTMVACEGACGKQP